MSRSHELQPDELELVSGGSTKLFSNVSLGPVPSHNYGLISDSFGANMSYNQANALLQQFNAPTRDALYGQGNDPGATFGMISRPGAQNLPTPLDWGGNVTLQHGDGFAVNTTIPGQHPLEGTISRNLVTDFHDDGGYQVLTLGQGQGGAQLATGLGTAAGAGIGGFFGGQTGAEIGGAVGGSGAQNASHLLNPELGAIAFSQLDDAMLAHANGTHNPNLDLPSGLGVEAGYAHSALSAGIQSASGSAPEVHGGTVQQQALSELAHDLNSQGPVTGSFGISSNNVGIYHFTSDGSKYYELENGHVVEKQVDESSGVDAAIAHQAALDAQHPQATPEGDIHLPDPPAPIHDLPPELTPQDGHGQSGPDHADNHGVDTSPADAGHAGEGAAHVDDSAGAAAVDTGSHASDAGNHSNDAAVAPVDAAPAVPVDTAPAAPIQVDASPPAVAPIAVPDQSPPASTGAYSDTNPVPVVAPVDPGVDSGPAGGGSFDAGGVEEGGFDGGFDGGFSGGFDGGGE